MNLNRNASNPEIDFVYQNPLIKIATSVIFIFIHGAWHDLQCWKFFQKYLAEHGFGSIAISLRGHGRSGGKEKFWAVRIEDYVKDLSKILKKISKPYILVGHSMGGYVVQHFLGNHCQNSHNHLIKSVILLASVPPKGILKEYLSIAIRNIWPSMMTNLTLNPYYMIGTPHLFHKFLFSKNVKPAEIKNHHRMMQSESYFAFLDMLGLSTPNIKNINMPMLILGAQNDALIPIKAVLETGKIYNAETKIIPNIAHDMMLDRNWKKAADEIIRWGKFY